MPAVESLIMSFVVLFGVMIILVIIRPPIRKATGDANEQ